jgi:hypothetical protein
VPETAAPKTKNVAPEGLTKDEVQAWEESLPEPADEVKDTRDLGRRVQDLEARLNNLEEMLNLKLAGAEA